MKSFKEIVEVAKSVSAYVLSDEAYRHLNQAEGYYPSIVDIYDKGISTGSMSKVFSMAGLRMGWIVAPEEVIEKAYDIRHYNMISCGMIDETIAAIALAHKDKILQRNLRIIRKNIEVLDQWIRLEPHIEYVKPSAGTTALLYYDMAIESSEFCRQVLKDTGVMIVPGSCFEMNQCFRIGYAFNTAELEKG